MLCHQQRVSTRPIYTPSSDSPSGYRTDVTPTAQHINRFLITKKPNKQSHQFQPWHKPSHTATRPSTISHRRRPCTTRRVPAVTLPLTAFLHRRPRRRGTAGKAPVYLECGISMTWVRSSSPSPPLSLSLTTMSNPIQKPQASSWCSPLRHSGQDGKSFTHPHIPTTPI